MVIVPVDIDPGRPERGGDHVADRKNLEILFQQRVCRDSPPHDHGGLTLFLHELEALEFNLAAPDIEGCDDLVVGRRRGVRHICFAKFLFDLAFEVLVMHVDHRPLAQ